jgi:hypothetical protein
LPALFWRHGYASGRREKAPQAWLQLAVIGLLSAR